MGVVLFLVTLFFRLQGLNASSPPRPNEATAVPVMYVCTRRYTSRICHTHLQLKAASLVSAAAVCVTTLYLAYIARYRRAVSLSPSALPEWRAQAGWAVRCCGQCSANDACQGIPIVTGSPYEELEHITTHLQRFSLFRIPLAHSGHLAFRCPSWSASAEFSNFHRKSLPSLVVANRVQRSVHGATCLAGFCTALLTNKGV